MDILYYKTFKKLELLQDAVQPYDSVQWLLTNAQTLY